MRLAEMVDCEPRQGLRMLFVSETVKGRGGLEAVVHNHDAAAVDGSL